MHSPFPLSLVLTSTKKFLKIKLAPCARTERLDGLTWFSSSLHHPVFPQLPLPHSPSDICSLDRLFRRLNVQFLSGLLTTLLEKRKQRMEPVSFKQCRTWLPLNRISQDKERALCPLLSSKLYKAAANKRAAKVFQGLQRAFIIKDIQQAHHRAYDWEQESKNSPGSFRWFSSHQLKKEALNFCSSVKLSILLPVRHTQNIDCYLQIRPAKRLWRSQFTKSTSNQTLWHS